MKRPSTSSGAKKPLRIPRKERRALGGSGEDWVDVRPLVQGRAHPTLVTPRARGLDLVDWARGNQAFVERLFEEQHALLFRDFELGGIAGFEALTGVLSDGQPLAYVDRSTPREEHGKNIYCSTIYPPEGTIRLHNEGSYWTVHPKKAFFCCMKAAASGGATPIGDVAAVHDRIDPAVREEFAARKWMLMRNFNEGFALTWQEVFQTQDRAEVDAYCEKNRIEAVWKDADHLCTRQVRDAILAHPRDGRPLWHNHAAFFHITSREEEVRDVLLEEFGEHGLPYNTFYGDGGSIDPEVIRHVNEAYAAERVAYPWQEGDVLLIDNCRIAHGREPYEGDRLVLVALMEGFTDA